MADALSPAHAKLLAGVDLFKQLSRVDLARLAASVDVLDLGDGATVCREGDAADGLYVVSHGTFGIFVRSAAGGDEDRVGSFGRGDVFGEMALLTNEPRAATVQAEGAGQVLRLERSRFEDLIRKHASIGLAVAATLAHRLRGRDHLRLQSEYVVSAVVDQVIQRLQGERLERVLEAGILADCSSAVLRAVFREHAASVGDTLAELGLRDGQIPMPVAEVLRARLEQAVGVEQVRVRAQRAAARLLAAQHWEAALRVLVRCGPPSAFALALARALRAAPPLAREGAVRWAEHLSDEDAAQDPELALARAAVHEMRGELTAAARVLRRALAQDLGVWDADSQQRLQAELARVGGLAVRRDRATTTRIAPGRRLGAPAAVLLAAALGVAATLSVGLAGPAWAFVLYLAAAIVLWARDVFPTSAVGLALVAAWIMSGIARPEQAVAGFASLDWVFVLSVFGIAAAVARSGLLFRLGLLLVRRLPAGLFWQAATLLVTGVFLTPLLPMAMGRAALTAPLALSVAEALRLRDRHPAAAVLGLAAWIGSGPLLFLFLNGSSVCLLAWALLPEASRHQFDWVHWFISALPLGAVVAVGGLVMLMLVLRPGQSAAPSPERVNVQLAVLGPPRWRELAMLGLLLLTVAGWIVAPGLGVDVGLIALLGLLGSVMTGNLDRSALQELDWNYLVFYGIALSLNRLGAALGLDHLIGTVVGGQLGQLGLGPLGLVLALGALALLTRLVLPPEQAILLLGLTLIPAAPGLGLHPWVIAMTLLATSVQWLLPSQTPSYLVAYSASEGRLYSPTQAWRAAAGFVVVTFIGLVLVLPYWHLLGLV